MADIEIYNVKKLSSSTPAAPTGKTLVTWQTDTNGDVSGAVTSPASLPPSGPAGGDLSGTYPNPTVAEVNGGAIPASQPFVGTNSSKQIVTATAGALPNGTTATKQTALSADTKVATDSYVDSAVAVETSRAETAEALLAPLASPAFTGDATAVELDVTTLKLSATAKDIIFTRSAAASLAITGSPNFLGSEQTTQLSTPSAPTVTPTNGSGSTWSYKIVARDTAGRSVASVAGTTAVGAANLDGTHFNTVTWSAVTGAVSYDVLRSVAATSPTTLGVIGNVLADATLSFVDNNVAGDASGVPTVNMTGAGGAGPFSNAGTGWIYCPFGNSQGVAGNTAVAMSTTNNKISGCMIVIPYPIVVRKVSISVSTTAVSATWNVGIYTPDGANKLLDASGSAAVAGQITATLSQAVTLQAGVYIYAYSCSDASVTAVRMDLINVTSATGSTIAPGLNLNAIRVFSGTTNSTASSVMPASLGTLTAVTTTAKIISLLES